MNFSYSNIITKHLDAAIQFIKFSLIGIINTSIFYLVFLILHHFVGIHYLVSSVIGYCAGLLNSFFFNSKWTFKTINVRRDFEFFKFTVVNIISLCINVVALQFAVTVLHLIPEIAQVLAIGFSTCTNFLGNKYWTFRSSKRKVKKKLLNITEEIINLNDL